MTVTHMWLNSTITAADNPDYARQGTYKETLEWRALSNVAALCSRAEFKTDQKPDVPLKERACTGDASEIAILKFMEFELDDVATYRARSPKVSEIPFNSTNKFHVTVHRLDINDPQRAHGFEHVLLMKGAPERILARSERIFVKGAEERMTDEWKERFNGAYEELVRPHSHSHSLLEYMVFSGSRNTRSRKFTETKLGSKCEEFLCMNSTVYVLVVNSALA